MPVKLGNHLNERDLYIDYPYEQVMFRRDHIGGLIYKKFYGQEESFRPVAHDNKLYNDALLSGVEIDRDEYVAGKKPDE